MQSFVVRMMMRNASRAWEQWQAVAMEMADQKRLVGSTDCTIVLHDWREPYNPLMQGVH